MPAAEDPAALEVTLPESTPSELQEAIAAEVDEMNSDSWVELERSGIRSGDTLRFEYVFSAPAEDQATDLALFLSAVGYEAEALAPVTESDEWTVEGTTGPASVTEHGLVDWVRRMVSAGLAHGECRFDGWSAVIEG